MYPFERFTEASKRVLTLAQEEAERSHHSYIGTEHILLGLLRERDTVASVALDRINVDITDVRRTIGTILGADERTVIQQLIPTSRVKTLIEISFTEARRMGDDFVGTEHILLGLLIEGEGIGAHVLNDLGANLERVRAEIDVVRKARTIVEEPGKMRSPTERGVASDDPASAPSGNRLVLFKRAGDAADDNDPVYVNPSYVVRLDPVGDNQTSITLRHAASSALVVRGGVHEVARRLSGDAS
jgi:ATP-dependent Clp protease ATP-binding subunit ClpA